MQMILAIDDKMDNLVTLSAMLKNLMPGCAVITAKSGMEGIEKVRAELPDVILLEDAPKQGEDHAGDDPDALRMETFRLPCLLRQPYLAE
jgi:DNA-binding NtrC family response regulator